MLNYIYIQISIVNLHLEYLPSDVPPTFPIYVTVRILSEIVAELTIQLKNSCVVVSEFNGVEPVKWHLEWYFTLIF